MQIRIIQSKSIILLVSLFVSGCAFESLEFTSVANADRFNVPGEEESDETTDPVNRIESQPSPTVNLERDFGKHALGTKVFNQIYLGMQTLTAVQASSFNSIRNQYNNFRASLPSSNDLNAFSATNVLAVFNLAFEFCDVIANNQAVRNTFFANTFFMNSNTSQVALVDLNTEDRRHAFVDHLLLRFLGNEASSLEHRDLMRAELLSLIADLRNPPAVSNRNLWASVCTAALGGASVNLF
jgi:hypothetical protein